MRVAIIAECFLPACNGVTNSVLRVVEHLERGGHQALVVAPGLGPSRYLDTPVERVAAVDMPFYRGLSVALPTGRVRHLLQRFSPDVVHLAAPAVLGAAGAKAARSLGIPSVAVYQTDFAGFARRYGLGVASPAMWNWLRRVHSQSDLTLAPSSLACLELARHRIRPVAKWGRGVDLQRFHPRHRSPLLRRRLAPNGETIVGYVGRLAPEKRVHLLHHVQKMQGVRVVVVGDGPSGRALRRRLRGAQFLGFQTGAELSQILASLDVFVHTGADETFCQTIQEALASGVPVVTPAAGGPMDLVRHGENGWLFPDDDPALLRSAVAELVADDPRRLVMGQRARASVERRSWNELGEELVALPRPLGDGRGFPPGGLMAIRSWIVVSVHDVAPATRQACEQWIDDLEELGLPTTMLVVPGPWKAPAIADDRRFGAWLRACQSRGHEIAQHGWTHAATREGSPGRRLIGRAVARGCAEFWTLEEDEAARRLALGRARLRSEGIESVGLVPPGWLASAGALRSMSALGYRYTTSHTAVIDFATSARHRAVALSHRTGGTLERPGSAFMTRTARLLVSQGRPVRIALHPEDAARPRLRAATLAAIDAAVTTGASPMTYLDVVNRPGAGAQVA